ncbi:MAG TPA: hypothetical protein DEB39_17025 [Planctomycetaceae bacterium]|nr:hypothetical protein [Planctomycetaceae bacterium]
MLKSFGKNISAPRRTDSGIHSGVSFRVCSHPCFRLCCGVSRVILATIGIARTKEFTVHTEAG